MKHFAMIAVLLLAAPVYSALAAAAPAAGVRIVVPAHDIARGETIGESDLAYVMVDGAGLMPGVVTSMTALVGMQPRRLLRSGESLRPDDVRHPIVVVKGETVTMIFAAPGVELTAMGRAMSEGGIGDTVTVQNPVSYRMIIATVSAPGTVRANGGLAQPVTRLSRQ